MDQPEHTDVVVLGLGPGGEYVAGTLAEAGLHVTGVESRLVGGECPYYGCVPSKMMVRAANLIAETRRVPGMAGTSAITPDWSPVARRIRDEATDDWNDKVAADRFAGKGGHLVRGRGTITGAGEVTVTGAEGTRVLVARKGIVINTGTDPAIPSLEGLADTPYWTNREVVQAERVPESLIVLGGGATGAEFTQVFARFGTAVTLVEALPRLVSFEEPEASELIERIFTAEGITVYTNAPAERVSHNGTHFSVHLGMNTLTAERLLVSTGRRTNLAALGVAAAGLDPAAKTIPTDGWMRAADGVWAIGDVTGVWPMTYVGKYQGRVAAANILGRPREADYSAVPRVVFTDPQIAAVGEPDGPVTATVPLRDVPRTATYTRAYDSRPGFMTLVSDGERLTGAYAVGPEAGEWLQQATVAIRARVPLAVMDDVIQPFPTFSEAFLHALAALEARIPTAV